MFELILNDGPKVIVNGYFDGESGYVDFKAVGIYKLDRVEVLFDGESVHEETYEPPLRLANGEKLKLSFEMELV